MHISDEGSNSTTQRINGYAKYQIRSTGVPRVLASETEVFSLEEEGETEERPLTFQTKQEEEKNRLFDCPLDSDEEVEKEEEREDDDDKAQNIRAHNVGSYKERSRLTDEFDLDGDSLSDELDLLPPISESSPSSYWSSKISSLHCCNPRIPSKCIIM